MLRDDGRALSAGIRRWVVPFAAHGCHAVGRHRRVAGHAMHCAFAPIELCTRRGRVCEGSLDRGVRVPGLQGGRCGLRHCDGGAGREAGAGLQLVEGGLLQERQEEEGCRRVGSPEHRVGGTVPTEGEECERLLLLLLPWGGEPVAGLGGR